MLGSPMFTKALGGNSFIQVFPFTKVTSPVLQQLTIMGWIRPDIMDEGTVLVLIATVPFISVNCFIKFQVLKCILKLDINQVFKPNNANHP